MYNDVRHLKIHEFVGRPSVLLEMVEKKNQKESSAYKRTIAPSSDVAIALDREPLVWFF